MLLFSWTDLAFNLVSSSLSGIFTVCVDAVLGDSCLPSGELGCKVLHELNHLLDGASDLLHRVQLSNGDSVVSHGAVVDGHSEGDAALVRASVPPAHRLLRVINLRGDAGTNQKFF